MIKIRKDLNENKKRYGDIECGTCFEALNDVFIKTFITDTKRGNEELAIRLADGQDFEFKEETIVTVLNNIELTIRR